MTRPGRRKSDDDHKYCIFLAFEECVLRVAVGNKEASGGVRRKVI